jgi:uncharacterized membrane protein
MSHPLLSHTATVSLILGLMFFVLGILSRNYSEHNQSDWSEACSWLGKLGLSIGVITVAIEAIIALW